MADSFAADLMVGLVPVQEASSEASFVMGLEYLPSHRTMHAQMQGALRAGISEK